MRSPITIRASADAGSVAVSASTANQATPSSRHAPRSRSDLGIVCERTGQSRSSCPGTVAGKMRPFAVVTLNRTALSFVAATLLSGWVAEPASAVGTGRVLPSSALAPLIPTQFKSYEQAGGGFDPQEAPGGLLDLERVSLIQDELLLELTVRTHQAFRGSESAREGARVCVLLARSGPSEPIGDLCVAKSRSQPVLRFRNRSLQATKTATRSTLVPSRFSRPTGRSMRFAFAPSDLPVRLRRFTWTALSRSPSTNACPAGCEDRVPDTGRFTAVVEPLAVECFGATVDDQPQKCPDQQSEHPVFPSPQRASIWPSSPCHLTRPPSRSQVLAPCAFGARARRATVALLGDSHAVHWRSALEVVAQSQRWRGVSITRPGCPFSAQIPSSPSLGPASCRQLQRETLAWLRAHPEVRTVFLSSWAQPPSGPHGGASGYGGDASAFRRMMNAVPASVRRLYVLRDIPGATAANLACIERRVTRNASVGLRCERRRANALTTDPAASAARSISRARVIDLTDRFCTAGSCRSIVNRALVYKDSDHMNAVFSRTLGPSLLRAVEP